MAKKTQASYAALFQYIERNVCQLEPKAFMTDYEAGLRKALREVYPDCDIDGCLFHFKQAVVRKAKSISGLIQEINDDEDLHRVYQKLLVLPLLPHHLIEVAFGELKEQSMHQSSRVQALFEYYERQWIRMVIIKFSSSLKCICLIQ